MRARKASLVALCTGGWLMQIGLITAHSAQRISDTAWHTWIQYNPLYWVPLFLTGICLYTEFRVWENQSATLATGLSVLAAVGLLWWATVSPGYWGDLLEMGGATPLFALLILAFAHPGNRLIPALSGRFLTLAGAASYALYILQAPMEHYFTLATRTEQTHGLGTFSMLCVFLVLVSMAVHMWFEQPAKDWVLKVFRSTQRRPPRMASAPSRLP